MKGYYFNKDLLNYEKKTIEPEYETHEEYRFDKRSRIIGICMFIQVSAGFGYLIIKYWALHLFISAVFKEVTPEFVISSILLILLFVLMLLSAYIGFGEIIIIDSLTDNSKEIDRK